MSELTLDRLQEETARVEEHLLTSGFTGAVVECFTTSKANAFENLLEPLQKLLRLSPLVAQSLGRPDLFSRILQKLGHNKAVIRLNLLRIVRSICDSSDEQGGLLRKYGLFDATQKLAETDSAVLVRNMASELVKSALQRDQHYNSIGRRRMLRRASSSTSSVYTGSSPFLPSTPLDRSVQSTGFFDVPERRPPQGANGSLSTFRPTSRDSSSGKPTTSFGAGASNLGKSRLPRTTSAHRGSRMSLGPSSEKSENKTPITPSFSHLASRRRPAVGDSR